MGLFLLIRLKRKIPEETAHAWSIIKLLSQLSLLYVEDDAATREELLGIFLEGLSLNFF